MAGALLALAAVAGCGAQPSTPPPGTTEVRVGISPVSSMIPARTAKMPDWMKMPPDAAQVAQLPDRTTDVVPEDMRPYVTIARAVASISHDPDLTRLVWQDHP